MPFVLIMLVALLNHSAFKGNKVLISLFAIDLGASPATIGVLYAMYSVFPILLSVYAGTVSDRFGFRLPVILASTGVVASLLLPFLFPDLVMLFVCATLAGMCNIFYVVAIQHAVGSHGDALARTRNYSIFSICVGVTSLAGPVLTGFAIDGIGHRPTFLLLAALPAATVLMLLVRSVMVPRRIRPDRRSATRGIADLIGNVRLRRVLIATAFLETGGERAHRNAGAGQALERGAGIQRLDVPGRLGLRAVSARAGFCPVARGVVRPGAGHGLRRSAVDGPCLQPVAGGARG